MRHIAVRMSDRSTAGSAWSLQIPDRGSQKAGSFTAGHHAMIERQRQRHHLCTAGRPSTATTRGTILPVLRMATWGGTTTGAA